MKKRAHFRHYREDGRVVPIRDRARLGKRKIAKAFTLAIKGDGTFQCRLLTRKILYSEYLVEGDSADWETL